MLTSSSRTINYTAVLAVIALTLFVVAPVSADVIKPINPTNVYFEKNGTPVNEPVMFTVNCYGNHPSGASLAQSKPSTSENVFSFSATCPTYGCTIFEEYERKIYSLHIDSCDLDGELNGEHFIIRNFASTPVPTCTNQYDIASAAGGDYLRYYRINDRYRACRDNNTGTSDYYAREMSCLKQYADEIKRTDMIPNNRGFPAEKMCTLRFALPPERYVPTPTSVHTPTPAPMPAYVVLISVILASGLAMMIRKQKIG